MIIKNLDSSLNVISELPQSYVNNILIHLLIYIYYCFPHKTNYIINNK